MRNGTWTSKEILLGLKLRRNKFTTEQITERLGRSAKSVREKLGSGFMAKPPVTSVSVPAESVSEMDRRMAAVPRDLTGWVMADPLVGFSALDVMAARSAEEATRSRSPLRAIRKGEEKGPPAALLRARQREANANPVVGSFD